MINILGKNTRPVIDFNPTNRQHRKWFAEYQSRGTWGHCPVKFTIPPGFADMSSACSSILLDFYLKNEFESAVT